MNFETEAQKYYDEGFDSYPDIMKNPYKEGSWKFELWREGRWDANNLDTENYN